jgi:hypothetical protein
LEKLTALVLESSELPPFDLSACRMLKKIKFIDCPNIYDLTAIRALRSLEEVHLEGVGVSDFTPLAALPQLKNLWISGSPGLRSLEAFYTMRGCAMTFERKLRPLDGLPPEFVKHNHVSWILPQLYRNRAFEDPNSVIRNELDTVTYPEFHIRESEHIRTGVVTEEKIDELQRRGV